MTASQIAPITGRFRGRVVRDLVGSLTVGTALGYYYWTQHSVPAQKLYREYDAKVLAEVKPIHDAWRASQGNQ